MKTRLTPQSVQSAVEPRFPDAASLAALRAWHAGLSTREAVRRYLGDVKSERQSSRSLLGRIRRQLAAYTRNRQREDLAQLFEMAAAERGEKGRMADRAIETLRTLVPPSPAISDDISLWLAPRTVAALRAHGIDTLAALTVRVPRRRRWWGAIPGLGAAGARQVEVFFARHPHLTERARALVAQLPCGVVVPWEQLRLPEQVDGSKGRFRAPHETCTLNSNNDYAAIQAWLALHEAPATQRTYRKEAERLILWAIVERNRALSSLTTEDATTYRSFLRRPTPHERWVGPLRPRTAPDWRPFSGGLSARSAAHALSILSAMFRWLIQQRYVLANPFAGIKVRGSGRATALETSRAFTEGEWLLVRTIADGLEWSYGWEIAAAQRLRFVLDFGYATGLRASELVGATLGDIETDSQGDHWLRVVGKGSRSGLVTRLGRHAGAGITSTRLGHMLRQFFSQAAELIQSDHPTVAEKLRRASPHWMRHTHATHALARGVELLALRDNMRHASISTTSCYLHGDDSKRARQLSAVFGNR